MLRKQASRARTPACEAPPIPRHGRSIAESVVHRSRPPLPRTNRARDRTDEPLTSRDRSLAFVLNAIDPVDLGREPATDVSTGPPQPQPILVQRIQHYARGSQVIHYMRFDCAAAFAAWCELDPVRFDDPLLHSRLRRRGDELLSGRG